MSSRIEQSPLETAHSRAQVKSFDYLQLAVGNAYQCMHAMRVLFGFTPRAYLGLETGEREKLSYLLTQGNIRLIVTSAIEASSAMAAGVKLHGDVVSELAFTVDDAAEAFHRALLAGAIPVSEPAMQEDEFGQVTSASVQPGSNDLVHTFIERSSYTGRFLPIYQSISAVSETADPYMSEVDHLALSFPEGELDQNIAFYTDALGLKVVHEDKVGTEYSAMNSKVVQNGSGTVRLVMMEPMKAQRRSQIEEFLKYNNGPGVQHLAFLCPDIIASVRKFREAGAEFLSVPRTYYDLLSSRVGNIDADVAALRELNILVDRDEWGYLLQLFSKPISGRPTLFFELIQRAGAQGFGRGNVKALFDAVEREQALRGNL
jgi:4-hydroxyphenylpyruvate dioxygenase